MLKQDDDKNRIKHTPAARSLWLQIQIHEELLVQCVMVTGRFL